VNVSTPDLILSLLAAVYVARVAFFVIGFLRERARWTASELVPTVSVIVPARNEEDNLERCIRSLVQVDYPADRIQIIVIDDRSQDRTPQILDQMAAEFPTIKPLHRTDSEVDPNLRGKPGALQYGIEHSDGELILMTDADCIVSPGWVRGMVNQFVDQEVGLVAGLTSITSKSFLDRVQDVEWTYTQSMAAGGVGNGVPLGCFGNNLAVRRSAFDAVGGYHDITFSVTEDLALQSAIHDAGYRLRHAIHPMTSVETLPVHTMREYLKQRHRWVRGGTALGMRAFWFVLSSLALWGGMVASAATGRISWLVAFIAIRVVADGTLISMAANAVNRRRLIRTVPVAILMLMSTELFLPLLALKKKVTWKNQVFRP